MLFVSLLLVSCLLASTEAAGRQVEATFSHNSLAGRHPGGRLEVSLDGVIHVHRVNFRGGGGWDPWRVL
jgi:hypothetical protein